MGGCAVLYLLTLAADPHGVTMGGAFSFLSPSSRSLFLFGASGAIPVFSFDRWWTVLSASWLHGGLLHIAFNLMWVRQLAPATANLFGPGRMVLIYSAAGASGFLLTSFAGAYFTFLPRILTGASFSIGASAAIFGLLGAAWGLEMTSAITDTFTDDKPFFWWQFGIDGARIKLKRLYPVLVPQNKETIKT